MRSVPERRSRWFLRLVALGLLSLIPFGYWIFSASETVVPVTRPRTSETHEQIMEYLRGEGAGCEVLLLGDSITERWKREGEQAWKGSLLSRMKIANAGVGGDRTQHVLWRLENGLLQHISPSVVVLLIGTNNILWDSVADIELGISTIIQRIQKDLPRARIILCAVPPWSPKGDRDRVAAPKVPQLNERLAKLALPGVRYWDWTEPLRRSDGLALPSMFIDHVHLSASAYNMWAAELVALLTAEGIKAA